MATNGNYKAPNKKKKSKSKVVAHLENMMKGTTLIKVRKGGKFPRYFRLDDDYLSIGYTGSKKMSCMINPHDLKMYINEIQEVREGQNSDVFVRANLDPKYTDDQCFTIIIGDKHRSLDLVAPDSDTSRSWILGLRHLCKKLSEADLATQQEVWLKELFKNADKNGDNALNLKEIVSLLKYLNIEVDLDTAKTVFEDELLEADTDKVRNKKGEDCLDIEEFISFYQLITQREEIEEMFSKYNLDGGYWDRKELQNFFQKEQNQRLSEEECLKLIELYEPCPRIQAEKKLSLDGFNAMINSPIMNVFNPEYNKIYQDMTKPLAHYFIDSSHNTYLKSDQLVGPSEVEAYIRALKRGCRCVELDCWDGSDNEPVIYHGHTLTSKILFKDVILAINHYAFEASEYPVILSIENHCSVEQQRVMASYMVNTFQDKLLTEPLLDDITELPSPEELKGKIIIKAKKLPEQSDYEAGDVSDEDEAADIDDPQVREEMKNQQKESKHKLARELSDIVIICQSVSFKSLEHSNEKTNFKQMSSYGENKAFSLAEKDPAGWMELNKWQISRIYPAGLRTDSSNYEAMPMFLVGAQIVALNYQTPDDPMHIYKGKFLDNGGCGYILKPDFMTMPGRLFNPLSQFAPEWKRKWKVTIISGYQLPKKKKDKTKSILDPYVKIDVQGIPIDVRSEKTTHIKNNGFHPVWNEYFEFDVHVPQLAVVRFRVFDYESRSSNVLVAQYCLPFDCLQPGFRAVHLKNKYGEDIWGSNLLIHSIIT